MKLLLASLLLVSTAYAAPVELTDTTGDFKIRCTIDPDIQPKFQSLLDREMRNFSSQEPPISGFIAEASNGHLICKENAQTAP